MAERPSIMWISFGLICAAALATAAVDTASLYARSCQEECRCIMDQDESIITTCSYNLIEYVPSSIPTNTFILDLSYNFFPEIRKNTFEHLNTPSLLELNIAHSDIESIDEDTFENTTFTYSLQKIFLSHNNLSNSQQVLKAVKSLKSLNFIDLSFNQNLNCLEIAQGLEEIKVFCDTENTLISSSKSILELSTTDETTFKNIYSCLSEDRDPIDYWLNILLGTFLGLMFSVVSVALGLTVCRNYKKSMGSWVNEEIASLEKLMAAHP